jgi:phosphoribosylformylglycinamidine cyclo-ligase
VDNLNYESAGVSIDTANDTKNKFKDIVSSKGLAHCTPINKVGAFASLVEIGLKNYENPVFVLKSEEPGSKQMLSIENNRIEWIARDLINHLINDIIVMGATPCAVLDTIICGKFEKEKILKLVGEMAKACLENNCILVGGETSEQPGMLPAGRYVLQASVLGIVDKSKIIDGNNIKCGDNIVALASNGLHTNGYSLVRKLMETKPEILNEIINGESFLDNILKPHLSYSQAVKVILEKYFDSVHGMAHITGGSIHDNLIRIMQNDGLQANVDLSAVKVLPIFGIIKQYANMTDDDMLNLSPFNNGVGLIGVADEKETDAIIETIKAENIDAYCIGKIGQSTSDKKVVLNNKLNWDL